MTPEEWGNIIVESASRNIRVTRIIEGKRRRIDSSGRLASSLGRLVAYTPTKTIFRFTSTEKHAVFVHEGVNGLLKKYNDGPGYQPGKGKGPPPSALLEYIKTKPIRIRNRKTGAFQKSTKARRLSVAFAMSRHIQKNGIAPIPFFREAIESNRESLEEMGRSMIETALEIKLKKYT